MAMDIETVHEVTGKSRMDRLIAVMVGIAAVLASLIALLEFHSNQSEERYLVQASRRSVDVFTRLATRGLIFSVGADALRGAITLTSEAELRRVVSLNRSLVFAAELGLATAESRAAEDLMAYAETLSGTIDTSRLDPQTADVIDADQEEIDAMVAEQNDLVDLAEKYGSRGVKGMFALSIVALGAVMIALAGMFGEGRAGRLALISSGVLLAVAAGWSGAAFLA